MKTVKIGQFHILELTISGYMDFCYMYYRIQDGLIIELSN